MRCHIYILLGNISKKKKLKILNNQTENSRIYVQNFEKWCICMCIFCTSEVKIENFEIKFWASHLCSCFSRNDYPLDHLKLNFHCRSQPSFKWMCNEFYCFLNQNLQFFLRNFAIFYLKFHIFCQKFAKLDHFATVVKILSVLVVCFDFSHRLGGCWRWLTNYLIIVFSPVHPSNDESKSKASSKWKQNFYQRNLIFIINLRVAKWHSNFGFKIGAFFVWYRGGTAKCASYQNFFWQILIKIWPIGSFWYECEILKIWIRFGEIK